ncbi:MAG: hypothetical protein WCP91_03950 [Candidatus Berkelbacteria bacterium]
MKKLELGKIKNKTIAILEALLKFSDDVITPVTYSGIKRNLNYIDGDPRRLVNNLKSLERRGYIEIDRKSDSVALTRKGRIKLIVDSGSYAVDGKWRMLSWDIPENFKTKRQQFCRSIRRIGFKQVQKSLWACPYIRADKVNLIICDLNISEYVAFLRVDKTDIESHLKQLFKIE